MRKNIEWLKNEVNELPLRFLGFSILKQREEFTVSKDDVLELINQLDEPEVLSQEWIDEHAKAVTYDGIPDQTEIVYVDDLQNLLVPKREELTEEQAREVIRGKYGDEVLQDNIDYVESQGYVVIKKPTIPPEADELIRRGKSRGETLTNTIGLMKFAGWNKSPYADGAEWGVNNLSDFVIAWEHGYEVEEEQKYRVIDSHKVYLLAKEEDRNEVETVAKLVEFYGHEHVELNYHLTEQEIKDYDPRYMAFAKPVEELEQ